MTTKEKLAAIQHEIWSHWMKYMFSVCQEMPHSGGFIIPAEKVERWKRQMETDYNDLTEKEKQSDIEVVEEFGIMKLIDYLQDNPYTDEVE